MEVFFTTPIGDLDEDDVFLDIAGSIEMNSSMSNIYEKVVYLDYINL